MIERGFFCGFDRINICLLFFFVKEKKIFIIDMDSFKRLLKELKFNEKIL